MKDRELPSPGPVVCPTAASPKPQTEYSMDLPSSSVPIRSMTIASVWKRPALDLADQHCGEGERLVSPPSLVCVGKGGRVVARTVATSGTIYVLRGPESKRVQTSCRQRVSSAVFFPCCVFPVRIVANDSTGKGVPGARSARPAVHPPIIPYVAHTYNGPAATNRPPGDTTASKIRSNYNGCWPEIGLHPATGSCSWLPSVYDSTRVASLLGAYASWKSDRS